MSEQQADIAIIGAGVGGCIAALALAQHYCVALIDKYQTPPPKVGECLPPAAQRIFNKLQLVQCPGSEHFTATGIASAWGTEQVQINDNLRNPDGFGWHVDRQKLEQRLRQEAQSRGVHCYWPYTLAASQASEHGWQLQFASDAKVNSKIGQPSLSLKATVVIDATGRHSAFARQQGVKRQQADRLVSVWMTFQSAQQNKLAHICPTDSGWWYCAPIPRLPVSNAGLPDSIDALCGAKVLAFQTDADLLPKNYSQKNVCWQAANQLPQLAETLKLADISTLNHHGMVAANSSYLSAFTFNNWFAIGDAAMSFDPLSSQGMFNAMASAMQLSDLINQNGVASDTALVTIAKTYNEQLQRIWRYYQQHKKHYYAQERRWHNSEFWRRRAI